MTGLILLIGLFAPSVDSDSISKAWQTREANLKSAELSWNTVRSTRDRSFGFLDRADSGKPSTLRFSGRQILQDGERLTAVMRDGRTRPAESDPEKARRQFRHVLLEERLAGVQTAPFVESISSVSTLGGEGPSRRFGLLEQQLFDVPVWSARPLSLFPGGSLIVDEAETARQTHHVCLSAKLPAGQLRTVWVEPFESYRLLRIINVDPDRGTTQADLSYSSADEPFPSSWIVQQLNSAGQPLDFMKARRTSHSINPAIDDDVFRHPIHAGSDDAAQLSSSALTLRRLARSAIDASRIVLGILWVIVSVTLIRARRSEQPKSDGQASPLSARARRLALVTAVATPFIAVLPMLPVSDPSMQEAYQRLEAIREQATRQDESSTSSDAKQFREKSLQELKNLSAELRSANAHRSGIWRFVHKSEPQDDSAWRDILRVADSELPTLIRSSAAPNDARERAVRLTLEKVDDHLAGVHPYMPPPKPVLIQTGLEASKKSEGLTENSRSAIILLLEIGIALSAWWIWRSRRRRRVTVPLE